MARLSIKPGLKTIGTLACILGLVIAGGGFLCAKQMRDLGALSEELKGKRSEVMDAGQLRTRLETALASLETTKRDLVHLEEGVSDTDYVPTLLIELDELAGKCGLTVEGVSVEKESAKKAPPPPKPGKGETPEGAERGVEAPTKVQAGPSLPYKQRTLSVEVKGGFGNIVDFIQRLTMFPKIVSVGDMKIAPSRTRLAGGDPALEVTITLKTYLWQEGKNQGKAEKSGD
jgi:Tfp pilus assembly protein PilO